MKKLITAALAVILLLCSLTALAEDCAIGTHFYLDGNSGYAVQYLEDEDVYLIVGNGAAFFVSVRDTGLDMAQFKALYGDDVVAEVLEAALPDGVPVDKELTVNNGIPWIGFQEKNDDYWIKSAAAISGSFLLQAIDPAGSDYTQLTALMSALHTFDDAEPQTAESLAVDMTWASLSGWYDMLLLGEIDEDINIIITPNGSLRLTNSTSSICPDGVLQDGKVVDQYGDEMFSVNQDGTLTLFGMTMVKRADVVGHDDFIGAWKLTRVTSGAQDYRADQLKAQGISIEFTAYANGSIDWHAETDSESDIAQGWGVDGGDVYFYNGADKAVCTLDGDELSYTITAPNGFQQVTYHFVRAEG